MREPNVDKKEKEKPKKTKHTKTVKQTGIQASRVLYLRKRNRSHL